MKRLLDENPSNNSEQQLTLVFVENRNQVTIAILRKTVTRSVAKTEKDYLSAHLN